MSGGHWANDHREWSYAAARRSDEAREIRHRVPVQADDELCAQAMTVVSHLLLFAAEIEDCVDRWISMDDNRDTCRVKLRMSLTREPMVTDEIQSLLRILGTPQKRTP